MDADHWSTPVCEPEVREDYCIHLPLKSMNNFVFT